MKLIKLYLTKCIKLCLTLIIFVLLLTWCITNSEQDLSKIANNVKTYDELNGKTYSKDEVYYRQITAYIASPIVDNIKHLMQFKCVREIDGGYYAMFRLEESKLFYFFDSEQRFDFMINLPTINVDETALEALSEGDSYEEVLNIDSSAIPSPISKPSKTEHYLLSSKKLLIFIYRNNDDTSTIAYIQSRENPRKEKLDLILSIDYKFDN